MNVMYKPYRYEKQATVNAYTGLTWQNISPYKLCAISFIVLGFGVLTYAFSPILAWQVVAQKTHELVTPIIMANDTRQTMLVLGPDGNQQGQPNGAVLGSTDANGEVEVHKLADGFSYFTPKKAIPTSDLKEFTVSVPRVGITDAKVLVNSNEFEKHLGHFPGSALPGEVGNVFVTGHSALPQFFSSANYKTIFSVLPKVDILDEIIITVSDTEYKYVVEKTFVVDPSDISVLQAPDPFGKYLTLMTCVPPGLVTKRLIVLARLAE